MTTTVTITTHSWPVEALILDDYTIGKSHTVTDTVEVIEPNSTRQIHLTDTRSVHLTELPIPEQPAEIAERAPVEEERPPIDHSI